MDLHTGKGNLFVVSAPSGSGKTTLRRTLLNHFPDMVYSISATTRKPRQGETDGVDYHFMEKEEFLAKLNSHCWAEWALVHGHYYGTSAAFLDEALALGKDVLLDIDVQGMCQIGERYSNAVTIFIEPPSLTVLRERLEKRGTDSRATIEKRMRNAEDEMLNKKMYRHVIVNDQLAVARKELIDIIGSYRRRSHGPG